MAIGTGYRTQVSIEGARSSSPFVTGGVVLGSFV